MVKQDCFAHGASCADCALCSVQTVPAAQTAKFAQLVISERLKKC